MALWIVGLALFCLLAWGLRKGLWGRSQGCRAAGGGGEERGYPVGGCRMVCKSSALAQVLIKNFCRSACLETKGWSWKTWPHLQTAVQFLWLPDGPLEFARDHLQLADNGIVALDWVVGPPSDKARKATDGLDLAVLLVVPNATGQISRNLYLLCQLALQKGYYPVIFNRRGQNGCPLATMKLQPFGDPADLKEAVAYIRFRHPTSACFAISEGSGSGLLLSYLGECGSSSYLGAVACISPILKAREWFERETPWLYRWSLLFFQKREISRYAKVLEEVSEADGVLKSHSLKTFEEALFCHAKSENMSWDAYWDRNEPLRDADEVAVPVLCLCSADDPLRGPPEDTIPWELFRSTLISSCCSVHTVGTAGFWGRTPGPPGLTRQPWNTCAPRQSFLEPKRRQKRTRASGVCSCTITVRKTKRLHPPPAMLTKMPFAGNGHTLGKTFGKKSRRQPGRLRIREKGLPVKTGLSSADFNLFPAMAFRLELEVINQSQ